MKPETFLNMGLRKGQLVELFMSDRRNAVYYVEYRSAQETGFDPRLYFAFNLHDLRRGPNTRDNTLISRVERIVPAVQVEEFSGRDLERLRARRGQIIEVKRTCGMQMPAYFIEPTMPGEKPRAISYAYVYQHAMAGREQIWEDLDEIKWVRVMKRLRC